MKDFISRASETKRNNLSSDIHNDCLDANEYYERVLLRIDQQIELLRVKIQSDLRGWVQRSNKIHNGNGYWRKLKKLDKGKYRLSSERSLHSSIG